MSAALEEVNRFMAGLAPWGVVHATHGYDVSSLRRASRGSRSGKERQFTAGRSALRDVLRELGHTEWAELGVLPSGAPDVPVSVVASLSHSAGIALAIGASSSRSQAVGVDIETRRLPDEAVRLLNPSSRPRAADSPLGCATRAFSMAEAAYKALTIEGRRAPRTLSDLTFDEEGGEDIAMFDGRTVHVTVGWTSSCLIAVAHEPRAADARQSAPVTTGGTH